MQRYEIIQGIKVLNPTTDKTLDELHSEIRAFFQSEDMGDLLRAGSIFLARKKQRENLLLNE